MSLFGFNVLDFFIMLSVAGLVLVGFFGGIARVIAGFFAFYISTVVAAAFYDELGDWFLSGVADMREATAHLLAFLFIMLALGSICMWAIGVKIKSVDVRRGRLAILNNVGGVALAVTAGAAAIAVAISVSVVILGAFNQASVDNGTENLGAVGRQIRGSALVPFFVDLQEPMEGAYRPWFPNGVPAILKPTEGV